MFVSVKTIKDMSGLDLMKKRITTYSYDSTDGRLVGGKYKSFQAALKRSYQAEWITLNKGTDKESHWRCLINPSRLTEQFDKKVISIDFKSGVEEGTIFWWDRTESYWMINLQQHTEEAYFRGTISRAEYSLDIEKHTYWAAVKGPEETSMEEKIKHQITYNGLNYTLALQVAKDSRTINYFSRHRILKLALNYKDADTGEEIQEYHNWKVVATDKYSSKSVIDVYLDEYYDNEMEDVEIDPTPDEPDVSKPHIDGSRLVYGFDTDLSYSIVGASGGRWEVSNVKKAKITSSTDTSCILDILVGKPTEFILRYIVNDGITIEQNIVVQSF